MATFRWLVILSVLIGFFCSTDGKGTQMQRKLVCPGVEGRVPASWPFSKTYKVCFYGDRRADAGIYTTHNLNVGTFYNEIVHRSDEKTTIKQSIRDRRNDLLGKSPNPKDPLVEVFLTPAEDFKPKKWDDIFLTANRAYMHKSYVKAWRYLESKIRKYCTKYNADLKIYSGKMQIPHKVIFFNKPTELFLFFKIIINKTSGTTGTFVLKDDNYNNIPADIRKSLVNPDLPNPQCLFELHAEYENSFVCIEEPDHFLKFMGQPVKKSAFHSRTRY